VNTYVAKGEQSQEAKDPLVAAKLKCAAGLAALDAKKYKVAAKKFSEVRRQDQASCRTCVAAKHGVVCSCLRWHGVKDP
jgi:COP9 signalosome complex subunit 1